MNVGNIAYYKITKSLGRLKVSTINSSEVSSTKFGMKITKIDERVEYGYHSDYQIELFTNGEFKDVELGGFTCSYIVRNNRTWYSSYQELHNRFTVEFAGIENGSLTFDTDAEEYDVLCYIVYAFILLAELQDSAVSNKVFHFLFKNKSSRCGNLTGTIGQNIDLLKLVQSISVEFSEQYPFMKDIIEKGIIERKMQIKHELYKIGLIDNPNSTTNS